MRFDPVPGYVIVGVLLLMLLTAACGASQGVDVDGPVFQAALDTAVAEAVQTQAGEFGKTLQAISASETAKPTSTVPPDTSTPEPSLTPVPPDALDIQVQVSVDTNCRSGPGDVYPYQAGFFVGDEASVYAVDPSGTWYYIDHPDAPEGFCWIWGFYAETSADTAPLPIYTPGPTPDTRPDFSAEFNELENCDGKWLVEFSIKNTGPVALRSVAVYVLNTENAEDTNRAEMNSFQARGGCYITNELESLKPGETGRTISQELSEDPTGDLSFATITVCTEKNLAVSCLTKEFYFTP
jgi:hypothetical protein